MVCGAFDLESALNPLCFHTKFLNDGDAYNFGCGCPLLKDLFLMEVIEITLHIKFSTRGYEKSLRTLMDQHLWAAPSVN